MRRRLPLLPTLIVAAAVATMIALGVWQIARAGQKEALLTRYAAAQGLSPVAWPAVVPDEARLPLFRRSSARCVDPGAPRAIAGRNRKGESGYSHLVDCPVSENGPSLRVDIGWSEDPAAGRGWRGGEVAGVIGSDSERGLRLISAVGLAGLEPSSPPSIDSIPNNHRGYALQWFLFAAAALSIYVLALRGRGRGAGQ